ncbi:MAG: N-acetylmuramoyl-L-alanine amidase [Lachnospiraceae bacterium]|nr:N-acetylmuramoyl-L-alanine amidase [Lachnospiraceae bacterium]
MKRNTGIMVLVIAVLCACTTAIVCLISFSKISEADRKIFLLESELAAMNLEKTEEIKQKDRESEQKTEKESEQEISQEELSSETVELESQEVETMQHEEEPYGHVVAIDPGHQGNWIDMSDTEPIGPGALEMKAKASTGTQGSYTGVPEYQLNLDISLALQTELEARGYKVILTRTDNDTAISNSERALKAYDEGAEIYVRIHANGSDDSNVSGALGMTPSSDNPYVGNLAEESYRLSECVLNAYCEETGFGNLGIQFYDNMTGINWSKIPVTILEMGFMTNESDDTAMQDVEMQKKMVKGIANGIDLYFGDQE